ncbi:MAG: carbohydrate kinase family protein [Eubacteriales bacterium]|jgi:sugar/nucleoside kinase (ribokinase family)
MKRKYDIVVAGSMLVDHIKTIRRLPGRSELVKIEGIDHSTGGCVCNTGIDLAILDPSLKISAIGVVGNDRDGDMIISQLKAHGINTGGISRRGQTSFTDVFVELEGGFRTFFQYGGACDLFDISDVDISGLDCDIFHIGYLLLLNRLDSTDPDFGTIMARLLYEVQKTGIKTSIDIVSENSDRFSRIVPPALKYTDYLIINEIEAGNTVGIGLRDADGRLITALIPEVLKKLKEMGVGRWAVIHCPEEAFGIDEENRYYSAPSLGLPEGWIVSTVGAGDAFCAGALLAAHRGLTLDEALIYGNAAAQVSLRSNSATGSMTTIEETLKIMDGLRGTRA